MTSLKGTALNPSSDEYPTEQRETLAEAPGLRVRLLGLAPGQSVPWHFHTQISDTFICLRGPMRVATLNPQEEHVLEAGDMHAVPPGTPHFVSGVGDGACRFAIIQGVGEYDYIASEDSLVGVGHAGSTRPGGLR